MMACSGGARQRVFIGFGCEDTRYSFVSHLVAAFSRKGISAVEADINGDGEANRRGIEQSRVCVVVFSEDFAFSKNCLEMLVEVVQLSETVIPVFYGVSRSVVMQQRRRFGEAFSEHERSASPDRVLSWRNALVEIASFPGAHESDAQGSDSELVEKIVEDVREKLCPTDKIGIHSRLQEIEDLLCKQSWGVRSIGIWGMGGIGKTTIAEAAFDQMSADYEASCFLRDFDKSLRSEGLYHLRQELLSECFKEALDISSSVANPSLLQDKLRDKRILVVLDDVRNPMDAESFLGGFDWFGPGSVIIITSRDKQVLQQCRVNQIYEVKGLINHEPKQLFCRYAFGKDVTDDDLPKPVEKVIEYANGNPKALSFYGRKLKGMKPTEMETAFQKLKLRPPYQIMELLKSSYDELSDNEKSIFLDIACFFRGQYVHYVMQLLEGCGFFPHVGINVLVEKCLVTILEGKVQMHNLIQDVAREIINGETSNVERCSRLWVPSKISYLLKDVELEANVEPKTSHEGVLGTEDIEGIFLDTSDLDKSDLGFTVKPMAFENMYNLRLLKIYSSKLGDHLGLDLSKGLKSLPHELRLLHWENYPLESLPQDFDPGHLVELNLPFSQLQRVWQGTKNLAKLKIVRLCHSQQLVEIFELSRARNLELMDLQDCTSLQSFPSAVHLEHLQVLNLSGCTRIKTFPEVPPNLKELYLERTAITEVPESVENLSKLVKLDLKNCRELVNIPRNMRRLKSLDLNLSGCVKLKSFPEISDRSESLQYLDLS